MVLKRSESSLSGSGPSTSQDRVSEPSNGDPASQSPGLESAIHSLEEEPATHSPGSEPANQSASRAAHALSVYSVVQRVFSFLTAKQLNKCAR